MRMASYAKVLAAGAATGMRSLSGPAALARERGGVAGVMVPMLAAAEMIADKTPFLPDRIDPLPLAGRAVLGAVAGGMVARKTGGAGVLGALLGAAAAVSAAHLAYHARKRLDVPDAVAGLLEDGLVLALLASSGRGR